MIVGIGVDSVEIARFAHWHTLAEKQLTRIFPLVEIEYCLVSPIKTTERFAARFAAREAAWKAFASIAPGHNIPFLTFCRKIIVGKNGDASPELIIDWQFLQSQVKKTLPLITAHLSLTHTKTIATALVIFEKISG
jgi:phosphopantetheine--protein transferase-like protein